MTIVLIHIGGDIPPYMVDCINQIRVFTGMRLVIVIPNNSRKLLPDTGVFAKDMPNITILDVEKYLVMPMYREFEKACFLKDFWNVTMGRLFILQLVMDEMSLRDVVHIENDVMMYNNPEQHLASFYRFYPGIAICPVGPRYASAAYLYAASAQIMLFVNNMFLQYFQKGMDYIADCINGTDITEMTMLCHFQRKCSQMIGYLPTFPTGPAGRMMLPMQSLWDGASIGQFAGGTNADGPGWSGTHHYFGAAIAAGKRCKIGWINTIDNPNYAKRIPVLSVDGKNYHINNLHIHCKKLKDFAS